MGTTVRSMRAIVQDRYGSIDDLSLQEVPTPVPAEDEVLVQVRAASVHPDVWHVVTGQPAVLRLMGSGLRHPKMPRARHRRRWVWWRPWVVA